MKLQSEKTFSSFTKILCYTVVWYKVQIDSCFISNPILKMMSDSHNAFSSLFWRYFEAHDTHNSC